jgi:hypothetical protein
MAKKIINDQSQGVGRTEFQLHISQFQSYYANKTQLIDYTEKRLLQYIKRNTFDEDKLILIRTILEDYISGRVAIAWKNGEPVYVRIKSV